MSDKRRLTADDLDIYSLNKALEENLDFKSFKCEKEDYNEYLRTIAPRDHNDNVGKVWVFTTDNKRIVGYVTVAMSQLSKNEHKKLKEMTSHSHIPALLLGQMARDIEYEGRGLGRHMKDWVILQALRFSKDIGCRLIILDSEDDKVDMYSHWGFLQTIPRKNKKKNTMFIDLHWYRHLTSPV